MEVCQRIVADVVRTLHAMSQFGLCNNGLSRRKGCLTAIYGCQLHAHHIVFVSLGGSVCHYPEIVCSALVDGIGCGQLVLVGEGGDSAGSIVTDVLCKSIRLNRQSVNRDGRTVAGNGNCHTQHLQVFGTYRLHISGYRGSLYLGDSQVSQQVLAHLKLPTLVGIAVTLVFEIDGQCAILG